MPTRFTVTTALPVIEPFAAVMVNCPAPLGVNAPEAMVVIPGALLFHAAHPVTSVVVPSASVPVALRITGCGACG